MCPEYCVHKQYLRRIWKEEYDLACAVYIPREMVSLKSQNRTERLVFQITRINERIVFQTQMDRFLEKVRPCVATVGPIVCRPLWQISRIWVRWLADRSRLIGQRTTARPHPSVGEDGSIGWTTVQLCVSESRRVGAATLHSLPVPHYRGNIPICAHTDTQIQFLLHQAFPAVTHNLSLVSLLCLGTHTLTLKWYLTSCGK